MEFMDKTYNVQQYALTLAQENMELVIYSLLCLFVPMAIGHPQFLVGTLVNAALLLAAYNLKSHKMLPVIMLPSVGVVMAGLIFGNFTMLLVFMIPFIWIANTMYVILFKHMHLAHKLNSWLSMALTSVVKAAFLFVFAALFVYLGILPTMFLTVMGSFQLYTAIVGGALAILVQMGKRKLQVKTPQ